VLSISITNNTADPYYEAVGQVSNSGAPVLNVTRLSNISTTTTFYLVAQASGTASVSSTIIQATRVG